MKIDREKLLKALTIAAVGLSKRDLVEQSSCYAFTEEHLITFNDQIYTRTENPLAGEVTGAVPADDLHRLLSKFPDGEVDVFVKKQQLRIKGKRREAAISLESEIHMPHVVVPPPKKWKKAPEKLSGVLLQAARCCGKDETQPTTTLVHVAPTLVEACDNERMFRYQMDTGFKESLLLPAGSLEQVGGLAFSRCDQGDGWAHFLLPDNHLISIRCGVAKYPKLDKLLELESGKKVPLPNNLEDILSRAEVMQESSLDASVTVTIGDGVLTLTSRKDTGWYKESRKVDYEGEFLKFTVHPKFLTEIISKKKVVTVGRSKVGGEKMKIKVKEATFVVSLELQGKEQ